MSQTTFEKFLNEAPFILGEGAVIERLRRTSNAKLDPHLVNSAFIYDEQQRSLLANTAALSPEDLNESSCLVEEEPEWFGRQVAGLHHELGLKILGGCCGTDERHIRSLGIQLLAAD